MKLLVSDAILSRSLSVTTGLLTFAVDYNLSFAV